MMLGVKLMVVSDETTQGGDNRRQGLRWAAALVEAWGMAGGI